MTWKKEYWLIAVIVICLVIYYYRDKLNDEQTKPYLGYLPVIGGLAFGLNTLIGLVREK